MVLCSLLDSMVKRFSDRREKEKGTEEFQVKEIEIVKGLCTKETDG